MKTILIIIFFRVYERYPNLLAEMYAYSMAAAHENLPHFQLLNYMVSLYVKIGHNHCQHLQYPINTTEFLMRFVCHLSDIIQLYDLTIFD